MPAAAAAAAAAVSNGAPETLGVSTARTTAEASSTPRGEKRPRDATSSGTQKMNWDSSSSDESAPLSAQTSLRVRGSMLQSPGTDEKKSKVAKDLR